MEVVTDLTVRIREMGPMTEFKELELEECWSGQLDTPELQEAYKATENAQREVERLYARWTELEEKVKGMKT